VTYDLKIDRLIDAPPELVFDTLLDPAYQDEMMAHALEGWAVKRFEIDLRIGGTWILEAGPRDGSADDDVITSVFTEVDRPRRLAYDATMSIGEWGQTVTFSVALTFEDQDGKTLLTVVQSGFETEKLRDAFLDGAPAYVESIQHVSEARAARANGPGK
jgi:uncharacterized protein YndB with AHSA1/START domain